MTLNFRLHKNSDTLGNFLEIIAFFFVDLFSLYLFFSLFKT